MYMDVTIKIWKPPTASIMESQEKGDMNYMHMTRFYSFVLSYGHVNNSQ